ncbi:MAG TPA: hypothetical protein VFK92_08035 [Burkholderiales bacterium]|nr:hypothetical protein [Burkholderiales bacterium]
MLARFAGTLAALAVFAPAQAQSTLELAERLYERAAIAAQLRPIPEQFAQSLEDYRGKMPDEAIAALVDAGKKVFAEDALRGEVVVAIAKAMTAEDIERALDWLDGLPGRRVTLAEAGAHASMSRESMQAYLESRKQTPASPGRERMIADLIRTTRSVELGASSIEAISLGVAVGMDATRPVEKRIGVAGLRARLRAQMPPEKVRATVAAMLPSMYDYVYREVTDADLAAYVRFSGSPLGLRYGEAVSAAVIGALARASVRIGEKLPAMPERKEV